MAELSIGTARLPAMGHWGMCPSSSNRLIFQVISELHRLWHSIPRGRLFSKKYTGLQMCHCLLHESLSDVTCASISTTANVRAVSRSKTKFTFRMWTIHETHPIFLARWATFLDCRILCALTTLFWRIKHFALLLLCLLTYWFMANLHTIIILDAGS